VVQVIANLLNNAAKYTAPCGLIELTSTCSGNWVEVAVRDNGCGIGPDFMPHVFELFSQAGRQPDRTQGGLGIGLALVGRLMKLHGVAVAVDSPGVGQGSTFTLRFPLAAAPAAIDADEGVQSAAPSEDNRSLHICVVDDNEDAAVSMAALLSLLGHQVEVFNTAEQLLEADRRDAYDVFLLDIGLPGMTGLELARRLRAQLASRAKLFALSGYGDQHDIAASRDSGFDDHFVKPVPPEVLFAKLQT
jgi:CheY-like chemotaxis protein/anti-sigma regulatory factor (Ser/Thr protein kinase)